MCIRDRYWRGAIKIHKKLLTHKTQKNHCASWDCFLPLTIFRPSHLFPEKILYRVLQLKNSARHSRQWLDKTTNVLSNHWRAIFFDFRTRYRSYESIQYDCRPVLHTTVRPRLIFLPSPVYNRHANCCSRRRGWLLRLLPLFNLRTRLREKIRSWKRKNAENNKCYLFVRNSLIISTSFFHTNSLQFGIVHHPNEVLKLKCERGQISITFVLHTTPQTLKCYQYYGQNSKSF